MKKLAIKSLLTTFIFLLIILIFSNYLIYNPLYETLEESLLENFVNITEANKTSFEYIVEKALNNASSVSSRTMIRNKIIEYGDGIVDLEELKEYTAPKYIDGIGALGNVIYSKRIVDNQTIADYGTEILDINLTNVDKLSHQVLLEDENVYLLVYSPIKKDIVIGTDIILFDLSSIFEKMNLENTIVDMVEKDEIIKCQEKTTRNPLVSECISSDNIVNLNVFYEVYDDIFLHISTPKDVFYNKFNNITRSSARSLIVVFTLLFIGTNLIVILFAKVKITLLDKSNEKHKRASYYDPLTGAYTRLYLNKWLKENNNGLNYSVAFIDVNKFKSINDTFGHQKGDQVLKGIVSLIESEIRDNDFVIRYGGDEFLILLSDVSKDTALGIIKRINELLKSSTLLDKELSFSYGVGEIENSNIFYDTLKEIDLEMYNMKNSNNK